MTKHDKTRNVCCTNSSLVTCQLHSGDLSRFSMVFAAWISKALARETPKGGKHRPWKQSNSSPTVKSSTYMFFKGQHRAVTKRLWSLCLLLFLSYHFCCDAGPRTHQWTDIIKVRRSQSLIYRFLSAESGWVQYNMYQYVESIQHHTTSIYASVCGY